MFVRGQTKKWKKILTIEELEGRNQALSFVVRKMEVETGSKEES